MSFTEFAVFLCLQTFWVIFLFFCHVVITLFTFCTCQCDFYAHDFSTSMCLLSLAASRNRHYATSCYRNKGSFLLQFRFIIKLKLGIKKRPTSTVAVKAYHSMSSLSSFFTNFPFPKVTIQSASFVKLPCVLIVADLKLERETALHTQSSLSLYLQPKFLKQLLLILLIRCCF